MGDPRRPVNKYSGPRHPWEAERLSEEKKLTYDYGLKNKKDIWKQSSFVKKIKDQIKKFNNNVGKGIDLERDALIKKLLRYNLIKEGQTLDDALELQTSDVMERRLQTIAVRNGLARTMKQARQFIVHGHIKIGGKKVTSPSYLVSKDEQVTIEFVANSSLFDENHPERKTPELTPSEELAQIKEAKEEKTKEELLSVDEEVAKEIEGKIEDSGAVEEAVEVIKEEPEKTAEVKE